MKATATTLGLTLAAGIAVGGIATGIVHAQQEPVTRTELMREDLADIEGRQGVMYSAELAPGVAAGKHTHPGPEFVYVLDGSVTLEVEGEQPATHEQGEAFHMPAGTVHDLKNADTSAPAKVLVFVIAEEGKPLATPAQ